MIIAYILKLENGDWRLYKKGWITLSRMKTPPPQGIVEVFPILIREDWNAIRTHGDILWKRFTLGEHQLLRKTWRELWTEFRRWEEMTRAERVSYTKSELREIQTPKPAKRKSLTRPDGTPRKKMVLLTCPHCGKEGGAAPMQRHHFENCKLKP